MDSVATMNYTQTVFEGTPRVFSWDWTHPAWGQLIAIILTATFVFRVYMPSWDGVTAPLVGYESRAEPALSVRMRFAKGALRIINNGCEKVFRRNVERESSILINSWNIKSQCTKY